MQPSYKVSLPLHLLSYPKLAKSSSNHSVHLDPPPAKPTLAAESLGGSWSCLSGVNWGTQFGKSSSHSEQIVHFGGSHENQKLKQVINILASLPRRGLMLISLSHLCFLFFPWHSLIFHNAGNSTLFDQRHSSCLMNFNCWFISFSNRSLLPGHSKQFPNWD